MPHTYMPYCHLIAIIKTLNEIHKPITLCCVNSAMVAGGEYSHQVNYHGHHLHGCDTDFELQPNDNYQQLRILSARMFSKSLFAL